MGDELLVLIPPTPLGRDILVELYAIPLVESGVRISLENDESLVNPWGFGFDLPGYLVGGVSGVVLPNRLSIVVLQYLLEPFPSYNV